MYLLILDIPEANLQMDANTRKLGKKKRDMEYSLHNSPALLYNASSRSFFYYYLFFVNG